MTERAEDVVDALQEAVRVHMLAEMPADDGRLAAMGFATLMIEYLTWRGRFVEPRPRRVHRAPSLQPTTLSAELAAVVDALQADLEAGRDVNPRLSSTVHNPFRNVREDEPGRSSDRDLLLADWDIVHLHLSGTVRPGRALTKRTGEVMFAVFDLDDVYLIGVFEHPQHANWAAEDIFADMVRAFPSAGLSIPMADLKQNHPPSDEDRLTARRGAVMLPVAVDGDLHLPRGVGLTTAGTPIWATRWANAFIWRLTDLRETDVRGLLAEQTGLPAGIDWAAEVLVEQPGFQEVLVLRSGDVTVEMLRLLPALDASEN